jgi:hypothetical protein
VATPEPAFRTSLLPIFVARLQTLRAIAPGLSDLPQPDLNELQSLLERAEKLVMESMGRISSEPESAQKPLPAKSR